MNERQSSENELLLKPADVAKILNISRSLSYRLLRSGDIPVVRIHHAIRVKPADLTAYIRRCREDPDRTPSF